MANDKITLTVATDVATNGTLTVPYPTGYGAGDYEQELGHTVAAFQHVYAQGKDFTLAFGSSNITLTWKAGITLAAGTPVIVGLVRRTSAAGRLRVINLGVPAAASAVSLFASAALVGTGARTVALLAGGQTFDVPRTVQIVCAADEHTKTFTVTGTDVSGATVSEVIAGVNTATATGKVAFKTVSSVVASAATTGAISIGTSAVLGLPEVVKGPGYVLADLVDGVQGGTRGTVVAGDPTGVGDLRGTYAPATSPNGTHAYTLIVAAADSGPAA